MAKRTTSSQPRPVRALAVLVVMMLTGLGVMALIKAWEPQLGLDLSGGTSITLTAKPPPGSSQVTQQQLDEAVEIIRNRVGDIAEAEVTTQGQEHLVVEVPGVDQQQIVDRVGTTAELRFRQVWAETAATQATPQPTPTPTPTPTPDEGGDQDGQGDQGDQDGAAGKDEKSGDDQQAGPSDDAQDDSQNDGADSGNSNRALSDVLTQDGQNQDDKAQDDKAKGESKAEPWQSFDAAKGEVEINSTGPTPEQQAALAEFQCKDYEPADDNPKQPLMTCDDSGATKYLLGPAIVLGDQIKDANPGVPQNQANWVVQLELKGQGVDNFAAASKQMYNLQAQEPLGRFSIVLDGQVVSAPGFESPILDGNAQISGQFTQGSATELANTLKYGALPLSFDTSDVSTVSPSLGSDQLTGGLIAGAIGLALVVVYSFAYYRGLGLVVVLSLAIAAVLTYEAVVLLGRAQNFTLTLAGIAGVIVAIGITADSFVVYFERLRDEIRDGKTVRTAVETGWARARRTILASDSVSLLAAIVLFTLSVGNVRGFAYALGLTTLVDLVVVFLFTKPLLTVLARMRFFYQGHALSGLDPRRLGVSRSKLSTTASSTRQPVTASKGA